MSKTGRIRNISEHREPRPLEVGAEANEIADRVSYPLSVFSWLRPINPARRATMLSDEVLINYTIDGYVQLPRDVYAKASEDWGTLFWVEAVAEADSSYDLDIQVNVEDVPDDEYTEAIRARRQ